jgi:excisionase family DNA binding protein
MEELLTIEELAGKLKVPKSWIYSRTRETGPGCLPRLKTGKYLRFEESRVMEWLRGRSKREDC